MKKYGLVETLGKYDIKTDRWRKPLSIYEQGRSFSIGTFDIIKNNDNDDYNYIIIQRGARLENLTKNTEIITEEKAYLDKIISYLKTKNNNYIIKMYYMDADAPLIKQAEYLASYIDKLSLDLKAQTINLLAMSKCGAMNFYVPKNFKNSESFKKTNLYTIASTFEPNILASPKIMYTELKELIYSKLGDNTISNKILKKLLSIYYSVNSNSHMDYDIAYTEGIPDEKVHLADKTFIENIFSQENLDGVSKLKTYKNFITGITNKTFKNSLLTKNYYGLGLCVLDDIIYQNKSDGMVPTSTQRLVESYIDTKSYKLDSAHHDVMSIKKSISDICYVMDETINEQNNVKIKVKNQ